MIDISLSEDCEPPPWYSSFREIIAGILTAMALVKVELSILLCGLNTIQALNARYRGRDAPTDVLSFPQYDGGYDYLPPTEGRANLGDIALSLPIARQNALRNGCTEIEEITQLIIHGILHLLGFDHTHDDELAGDCMLTTQRHLYRTL